MRRIWLDLLCLLDGHGGCRLGFLLVPIAVLLVTVHRFVPGVVASQSLALLLRFLCGSFCCGGGRFLGGNRFAVVFLGALAGAALEAVVRESLAMGDEQRRQWAVV